jgi:hypothetical protein
VRSWAQGINFQKMAKVNNHPRGENSPNPVTLYRIRTEGRVSRVEMPLQHEIREKSVFAAY